MSKTKLTPAEIEAMKLRVEESLEDAEGAALALEKWMTDWRIRMAEHRAKEQGSE